MADDVFKIRLITQEWPHAAHSVKKIALSFMAFARENDPVSRQSLYEKFEQELASFEFTAVKLRGIAARCHEEAAEYRTMQTQIDASTTALAEELVLLKQQLEDERQLRVSRQQFEESARRVNTLPSRDILAGRIATVEADYAAACTERASLDERLSARSAQLGLLMASIAELQQTFAEDEAAARLQRAAAAAASATVSAPAAGAEADVDMRAGEGGGSDSRRRGAAEDAPAAAAAAVADAAGSGVLDGADDGEAPRPTEERPQPSDLPDAGEDGDDGMAGAS